MLITEEKKQLSSLLEDAIERIDITPSQFELVTQRYQTVSNYLGAIDSPLYWFNPDLKPQGSMRLGTVIRPWGRDEEFDLDITCKLTIPKDQTTQQQLKKMVGDRLKQDATYRLMLDKEKRRCWRLQYSELPIKFHMDIVPSIPDEFQWLIRLGVPVDRAMHAINITDKETWTRDVNWPKSNPEGYALWFESRMKDAFESKRKLILEELSVADVPSHRIKTPLQRAVQFLKRHRDSVFGDAENKPISIIITTLSAHSYGNEENLYEAINNILAKMDNFIKVVGGQYIIENPVNPLENFADKWNEDERKKDAFYDWLQKARLHFKDLQEKRGLHLIAEHLSPVFGVKNIEATISGNADKFRRLREQGELRMAVRTGALGTSGVIMVPNHNFHGKV